MKSSRKERIDKLKELSYEELIQLGNVNEKASKKELMKCLYKSLTFTNGFSIKEFANLLSITEETAEEWLDIDTSIDDIPVDSYIKMSIIFNFNLQDIAIFNYESEGLMRDEYYALLSDKIPAFDIIENGLDDLDGQEECSIGILN